MGDTSQARAKVLIVDDDQDIIDVLNEWLLMCGYDVHTSANGSAALVAAKHGGFDVVLTDLEMPGLNGHQLLAMLKEIDPALQVIFLSGKATIEDAIAALREGKAFDFLQKPLRDLRSLGSIIDRAIARRQEVGQASARPLPPPDIDPLSARELEVVRLLAQGMDNKSIAERLVLSEKTVQNHLTRIYEKLRVTNRTQAVVFCQTYGLI